MKKLLDKVLKRSETGESTRAGKKSKKTDEAAPKPEYHKMAIRDTHVSNGPAPEVSKGARISPKHEGKNQTNSGPNVPARNTERKLPTELGEEERKTIEKKKQAKKRGGDEEENEAEEGQFDGEVKI